MTETSISDRASPRSPPTRDKATEMRSSRGLVAPCHQTQGASLLVQAEPPAVSTWPSSDEFDVQEAARNFQAYLEILQEWDEKEKQMADHSDRD